MMELANASFRSSREHTRVRDEEVAKLQEELERERASRFEATAEFEEEMN